MDWVAAGVIMTVAVVLGGALASPYVQRIKNLERDRDEGRNKVDSLAYYTAKRDRKAERQRGINEATQLRNEGRLTKLEKKTK